MTTQELWQAQELDAPRVTPAYLRVRAGDSARVARRRNFMEYGACALAAACATWMLFDPEENGWKRAGFALMIVSAIIYAWRWWRLATPTGTPADLGALDTLRFHRRELERQRDAWRGNWRWSIPLFAPSIALVMFGQFVETPNLPMARWSMFAIYIAGGLALVVAVCEQRARKLRRDIEALDLLN